MIIEYVIAICVHAIVVLTFLALFINSKVYYHIVSKHEARQ